MASLGIAPRRRCSWRTVRAKLSPPKTSCVARGAGCNARHRPASLLSDENCHLLLHPPRVLLSSCGFCCSSTLCLGFRTCACTFDSQIRLLGWSPHTRPALAARVFQVPGPHFRPPLLAFRRRLNEGARPRSTTHKHNHAEKEQPRGWREEQGPLEGGQGATQLRAARPVQREAPAPEGVCT